jgi:hypothetical protein
VRRRLHRQAFDRYLDQRSQIADTRFLRSRDLAQALPISAGWRLDRREWPSIDVEFENSGDHHDRAVLISILVARVAQRRIAADEEAAAAPNLLLNDPVPAAVLADQQDVMSRTRGRFNLFALSHDLFLEMRRWAQSPSAGNVISIAYEIEMGPTITS